MEKNENLVIDMAENVERTTEKTPVEKTYGQTEVDTIASRSKARGRAQAEREAKKKYGEMESFLMAGTKTSSLDEAMSVLKESWGKHGVEIPAAKAELTDREVDILAGSDASDIIQDGGADDEIKHLESIPAEKRTARENALLNKLRSHVQTEGKNRDLAKIGVTPDVYNSKEFRDFAAKFADTTPITDVYALYEKTNSNTNIQTMGSMKNTNSGDSGLKDHYSYEEAKKFTEADYAKTPGLWEKVRNSMTKW